MAERSPAPVEDTFLIDGPKRAPATVALAHGAGAGKDAPFLETVAKGLAAEGLRVVRFEFPYMHRRRIEGKRAPPDREPVLLDAWRDVAQALSGAPRLVLAGKSMGGRMASLVADELLAAGRAHALACLGYPFHPPGKPEKTRTAHLEGLTTPTLILQGTRDPFGTREEVEGYALSPQIRLHFLEDGEHSFKPRKSSGRTEEENLHAAIRELAAFARG